MTLNTLNAIRNVLKRNTKVNFLFCDIQDKYIDKIYNYQDVINVAEDCSEISKIFQFNQIVTQQKSTLFGETVPEIKKNLMFPEQIREKKRFSMISKEEIKKIGEDEISVIVGIEAHVCVFQTSIDFIENQRKIVLLADGVSSTSAGERALALKNLSKIGVNIMSSQNFLFSLFEDYEHEKFKTVLPIMKRSIKRQNKLLNDNQFL